MKDRMKEATQARRIVRDAGIILLERHRARDLGTIEHKDSVTDLVTSVDREIEALILTKLRQAFPGDAILSEERGQIGDNGARLWILDPLDGTKNFVHALDCFAISLALVVDGIRELGIVFAPALGKEFWAVRGEGAWLGEQPIRVSQTDSMEEALFSTGFACLRSGRSPNNLSVLPRVLRIAADIRRHGSAALDLCYVAYGRTDGFWELGLSPWDVAAGSLIAEEAGGQVTDFHGKDDFLYGRNLVTTNGRLHEPLLGEITRGLAKS